MPNFAKVLSEAQATAKRLTGRVDTNTAVLTAPSSEALRDEAERFLEHQYRQMEEQRAAVQANSNFMQSVQFYAPQYMYRQMFSVNGFGDYGASPINSANGSAYDANGNIAARVMPVAQVVDEPSRSMLQRVPVEVQNMDLSDPRKKLAAEAEDLLGYTVLRKELRTPGTLRRVLAKLEITILEEASVDKYKAQMVEHYRTANKMADPTWRLTALRHAEARQRVPDFAVLKAIEIKRELPEAEFYVDQLAIDPFLIVSLKPILDNMRNTPSRNLDPETAAYIEVWGEPEFEATM